MQKSKVTAQLSKHVLYLKGEILISEINSLLIKIENHLKDFKYPKLIIDLSEVDRIDTAGIALLDEIIDKSKLKHIACSLENIKQPVKEAILNFSSKNFIETKEQTIKENQIFFQQMGDLFYHIGHNISDFVLLLSDTSYFAFLGLFSSKGKRKGEFINQCILIGINALPIIAMISFLIGFILALQSAAQLRQFGASIYVADLISISMTREMGPIMTAIVVAGRSGSAITSEIATMVVTEETDALKSMALNPIRYVLVPKVHAIMFTMPMLTILSIIIGILGGLFIGLTYLDIGIEPFYNQVRSALVLKDIITGLIKSLVFAWLIVIVAAYFGFGVKGGAEGVGRATTSSVVASIFSVILADSILGLIFYFPLSTSI
jgi:phospholipid/cholesterol/gamma-HCH transport system permease protein